MSRSGFGRSTLTILFVVGTAVVLLLAYVPTFRVHRSWEDEVYWFSTCLSMVRSGAPIPSALADFPGTQSPLRFYGPTVFWLGALALKLFGATVECWRSFTFVGEVISLAAIAILFRRLRNSWLLGAAAAFILSFSIGISFGFSLPGRPDGWGIAILVGAMAIVAQGGRTASASLTHSYIRWLLFGLLLGLGATTSPRTWPLVFSMVVFLPLLVDSQKVQRSIVACAGILFSIWIILLPLHMSPFGFLVYVRGASAHDSADISPVMGGSWGFGHAMTQIVYYGGVFVVIGVLQAGRWRELDRFAKWLLAAGLLNLLLAFVLLSRALNMPVYWGFPLEISALMGLTMPLRSRLELAARYLGIALFVFMMALRTAREVPVFAHWHERDPALTERALAAAIPSGSIVYGSMGDYFYPTLVSGSDYRYLFDSKDPGRSSIPGVASAPAPMTDACTRAAYVVWPAGGSAEATPHFAHASMTYVASYSQAPEREGRLEMLIEKVPGGRADRDDKSFSIYRLQMDPGYCRAKLGLIPHG